MKLTTNFTLPIRKVLLVVFILSIAASTSALALAYYLGRDRASLLQESAKLNEIALALSSKANTPNTKNHQGIELSEASQIRRHIEKLNAHTPIKGLGVNRLLAAIEDLLPEGVKVNRLGYSAIDGQLVLMAEANNPDRIYLFMNRLEQSPLFASPLLQQHPGIGDSDRGMAQYEIQVVALRI